MLTLKDVAKKAGVSVPTVSRVINNCRHVKKTTRTKTLKAIEELSYEPNKIARNLRLGRTNSVGFLVPHISTSFFGEVVVGMQKVFLKRGYHLILCVTSGRDDIETESLKLLVSQRVDGIIMNPIGNIGEAVKKIFSHCRIPLLVIDNKVKNVNTDAILHDDIKGTQKLTSHLIRHGHEKIAFIGGSLYETSGKRRLEGYKKALIENSLPIVEDLIRIGNWTRSSGFQLTKKLLKMSERPTGIVAANVFMALGVILALQEEGLKIPRDIALVSFDDSDFLLTLESPLTTLRNVDVKMGEIAARLLLKRVKNPNKREKEVICLPTDLIIRDSCGCKEGKFV